MNQNLRRLLYSLDTASLCKLSFWRLRRDYSSLCSRTEELGVEFDWHRHMMTIFSALRRNGHQHPLIAAICWGFLTSCPAPPTRPRQQAEVSQTCWLTSEDSGFPTFLPPSARENPGWSAQETFRSSKPAAPHLYLGTLCSALQWLRRKGQPGQLKNNEKYLQRTFQTQSAPAQKGPYLFTSFCFCRPLISRKAGGFPSCYFERFYAVSPIIQNALTPLNLTCSYRLLLFFTARVEIIIRYKSRRF